MLDTVSAGVMSAMARMYLIVMGFLQRLLLRLPPPGLRCIDIDQHGDDDAHFLGPGDAAPT
jgi:hypothetical protein